METNESGNFVIEEELVLVNQKAANKQEILSRMAELLAGRGYVKESYFDALMAREEKFPTGLMTKVTGAAIPHTDPEHVNIPAVAVATLQEPVNFRAMDDPDKDVPVELIMMLAIKDPDSQIKTLQKIMFILQNADTLTTLHNAKDSATIIEAIKKHLA